MTNAGERVATFRKERQRQNARIAELQHLGINRFFRLDSAAYEDGPLPGRTKELLGLVASLVLRCDDCVTYHLDQCVAAGWTDEEIADALNVGLVVGGSIVIPHLRRAVDTLDAIRAEHDAKASQEGDGR
ncbi:MAG TPA: carboxymuconolactone decarboxylase family protein [Thermomicrobiales bacterium]